LTRALFSFLWQDLFFSPFPQVNAGFGCAQLCSLCPSVDEEEWYHKTRDGNARTKNRADGGSRQTRGLDITNIEKREQEGSGATMGKGEKGQREIGGVDVLTWLNS
jgi:hypothetical protein